MSDFEPNISSIPEHPGEQKSGGKGKCCVIGCFLLLLIIIGLGVGGFFALKHKAVQLTEQFTADKPVAIKAPQGTPQQVSDVFTRFDTFRESLAAGKATAPLVLSDHDINLLMYHHSLFESVSGKTEVKIENDKLSGKVSLKLDDYFGTVPVLGEMLTGRYLNGDATIDLSLQDGKPSLFLEGLTVNGMAVPPEVIKGLRKKNILGKVMDDENLSKLFEKVDEIKIEGNKLHIIPKK